MANMVADPRQKPQRPRDAVRPVTVSIAVSALVLTAILLTAAVSSLVWWRTAEAVSQQLASTINAQIVAAVRKEVSAIVDEALAAHTAIRTLFLQNVLDTREADKREFVFLSQLQSQATISWAAFGWPDGSFFAAHKLGDRHLEMMEISLADHPGQRRVDEYEVIPGDIEFEHRRFEPTDFRVSDQTWFKAGITAAEPQWFKLLNHPIGERPSIAFAGPIDVYQERQGVLAIIIEYAGYRVSSRSCRSDALERHSSSTAAASLSRRRTRMPTNCMPRTVKRHCCRWRKWRWRAQATMAGRKLGGAGSRLMARPMRSR